MEPSPRPPPRPAHWATVLLSVLLGSAALLLLAAGVGDRLASLERPVATAVRVLERDILLDEALGGTAGWQRAWLLVDVGTAGRAATAVAIEGYGEVLTRLEDPGDAMPDMVDPQPDLALLETLRARRSVLLAETGRQDEALAELRRLPETPRVARFAEALAFAYQWPVATRPPSLEPALALLAPPSAPEIDLSWSGNTLARRYYTQANQPAEAQEAAARLEAARADLLRDALLLSLANLPLLAGLGLGLIWLVRRRRLPVLADGLRAAPWSFWLGYAVMARSIFWALVLAFGVAAISQGLGLGTPPWTTLIASLPMLWLGHRFLLRPFGLSIRGAFGIGTTAWRPLLAVTLVLAAIEQTLSIAVALVADALRIEQHWSEAVVSQLLWSPTLEALLLVVEGVVWAPIFEEIGFRGLLYTTLRTRLPPLGAAGLSAALFSVVHLYSATGFATLFLGAVASALVYERTRSLLPAMLAHAFNNVLAFGANWLLYR